MLVADIISDKRGNNREYTLILSQVLMIFIVSPYFIYVLFCFFSAFKNNNILIAVFV